MNIGVIVGIIAVLALGWFVFSGAQAAKSRIDGPSARALVKGGARLVDVRTPGEFAAGHIEGAVNVPLQQLSERLGELPRDRDLVLYCRSGHRSHLARKTLEQAGFTKLHDLGPKSAW